AGFPLPRERRSARSGERRWGPASAGTTERKFGQRRWIASVVVPAKAGTQWRVRPKDAGFSLPRERRSARSGEGRWVPASAGTTERKFGQRRWIASVVVPAKAGTQWRVRAKDAGFSLAPQRRSRAWCSLMCSQGV